MSESVDIAIIGGGSSGINLARELCQIKTIPHTLVIEPKTPKDRDCSWALWAEQPFDKNYAPAIKGSWPAWQLVDHNGTIAHVGAQYSYLSLSAEKYLTYCESQLKEPISLRRDSVKKLQTIGDGGLIMTTQSTIDARYIYDSRPKIFPNNALKQHFLGWEIITKEPIQNPHIATLMDFRTDQSQGVHFIYVLPFSPRHLLVESTLVTQQLQPKDWYRHAIQVWLKDRGIEISQQVSEEYGVIPLDNCVSTSHSIGASSGAIRRSSGYAFVNIQQQTKQLAHGIAEGNYRVPKPITGGLNFMDSIFNDVLLNHPNLSTEIFMRTARALNADQFAQFMLGQADTYIWAKVVAAMPKIPFIKQTIFSNKAGSP